MIKKRNSAIRRRQELVSRLTREMAAQGKMPEVVIKTNARTGDLVKKNLATRVVEVASSSNGNKEVIIRAKTSSGDYVDGRLLEAFRSFEDARSKERDREVQRKRSGLFGRRALVKEE